jgi:hypothetical protein
MDLPMNFIGVDIPPDLLNCRNVWLHSEQSRWVISTRMKILAVFAHEAEALDWWNRFEAARGYPN